MGCDTTGEGERKCYLSYTEDLLYNSGNTYALPLLLYHIPLGSSIHPEHVDAFHKGNFDAQFNFWSQKGAQMSVDELMDYDPYLGRVSGSSHQPNQD